MMAAFMLRKCQCGALCFTGTMNQLALPHEVPARVGAATVAIGLFADDVHGTRAAAVAAGGKELDPVRDYDYDYRQGCVADALGHQWILEKRLNQNPG